MVRAERLIRLDLEPTTAAPRAARMALAAFADVLPSEVLDDATLLTSEVVSRWISEPGVAGIQVRAWTIHDGIRVAIGDEGTGPGAWGARVAGEGQPIELGLVASIAHGWGVQRGEGTVIWFELRASTS